MRYYLTYNATNDTVEQSNGYGDYHTGRLSPVLPLNGLDVDESESEIHNR